MKKILSTAIALCLSPLALATPALTYTYSGNNSGIVTIQNNTTAPVQVGSFAFDAGITINSPWGSLSNGAKVAPNCQKTLCLTYTKPIEIAPLKTASLEYQLPQSDHTELGQAELPTNVSINGQTVPLEGMCSKDTCKDPAPGKIVSGYFADWDRYGGRNFFGRNIPFNRINDVEYAFIHFDYQGNVSLYDPYSDDVSIPQIAAYRLTHPYLNFGLSFGGWQDSPALPNSPPWSAVAYSPKSRQNFETQSIHAMQILHANGINIDWEYPASRISPYHNPFPSSWSPVKKEVYDARDFVTLITEMDNQLAALSQKTGKSYYLSIAAPGGKDKIDLINQADPGAWKTISQVTQANAKYVKFHLFAMTYDYHGQFDRASDFSAPYQVDPHSPDEKSSLAATYDIAHTLSDYRQYGFSPASIVIGVPMYGDLEQVACYNTYGSVDHLYCPFSGVQPLGSFGAKGGNYPYRCILDKNCAGKSIPSTFHFVLTTDKNLEKYSVDDLAFSKNQFISWSGVSTVNALASKVKSDGYGGMMFWDLYGDIPESAPDYTTDSLLYHADLALNSST